MSEDLTELEREVVEAAITWLNSKIEPNFPILERTVRSLLAGRARLDQDHIDQDRQLWVERTWRDVRENDIVRPPGQEAHASLVVRLGVINRWHTHPHNSRVSMEWSAIRATLRPLVMNDMNDIGGNSRDHTPPNGMNPDGAVEIQVTRGELAAIEALGGWGQRVAVYENDLSQDQN